MGKIYAVTLGINKDILKPWNQIQSWYNIFTNSLRIL